jgi:hypothetical protein
MTKFTAAITALIPLGPLAVSALVLGSGPDAVDTVRSASAPATEVVDATLPVVDPSIPATIPTAIDVALPASLPVAARPEGDESSATAQDRQIDTSSSTIADPFAPISSPDVGDHCARSLDAADINDFFSHPIGNFQGADYQRAFRLNDDRVLWTFQDAFIGGTLVHNVGFIQSGRCFTLLNSGARSWLLGDVTSHMQQWQWVLGGGSNADGTQFHLFVVQMNETGNSYLSRTRPTALRRVVLDVSTLDVLEVIEESMLGDDLYGWGVTSDAEYTYLYSHCYQQFGYDTMFGFGKCVVDVKLARIPLGEFDAAREYWDGINWTTDRRDATPVVDASFVGSGNNPAQIRHDGKRFLLVQKRDDWWGATVNFGVASDPQGPFALVASVDEPLNCDRSVCNTYFASWVPWNDSDGDQIWSIGHNRWNGSETHSHLADYRPTFSTVNL